MRSVTAAATARPSAEAARCQPVPFRMRTRECRVAVSRGPERVAAGGRSGTRCGRHTGPHAVERPHSNGVPIMDHTWRHWRQSASTDSLQHPCRGQGGGQGQRPPIGTAFPRARRNCCAAAAGGASADRAWTTTLATRRRASGMSAARRRWRAVVALASTPGHRGAASVGAGMARPWRQSWRAAWRQAGTSGDDVAASLDPYLSPVRVRNLAGPYHRRTWKTQVEGVGTFFLGQNPSSHFLGEILPPAIIPPEKVHPPIHPVQNHHPCQSELRSNEEATRAKLHGRWNTGSRANSYWLICCCIGHKGGQFN